MSIHKRTTLSIDGVNIAYSVSGTADTAIVCIHGGLADRSFWEGQHGALSDRFKIVSLDLAGHGESGRNRQQWSIPQFANDVAAVIAAEQLEAVILVGNSLGGSVALETAVLPATHTVAVVGVDTFQDLGRVVDPDHAQKMADVWRRDFDGALDHMLRALFHADVDLAVRADVRQRMAKTPPETVWQMFASFGGYNTGSAAGKIRVPVRSINGDLFPVKMESVRSFIADFDAVILPHTGHFPMLERPAEFNSLLAEFASARLG